MLCSFCNFKDNNANDLFCKSCGKIIDKRSLNAFEIFNQKVHFKVDVTKLDERFLELQKAYHPDKYIGKDDEKKLSISNSTHVNKAYKILKNYISRAKLILEINSIETENKEIKDMEFLMKTFEWREKLADKDNLNSLEDTVNNELENELDYFADAVEERKFDKAKDIFLKLKFYRRFLDEIDDAKDI